MRDVAVVGFAQRQMPEFDGSPTCVELLVPLFKECYEQTGWTRKDVGFWCSGSSDYLAGRSFSFVPGGRRDRRHPAGQRVARRDGPRLGDVRGLDQDPDRRGRHRAGLRLRQELGRRAAPHARAAARPVHDDPAVARHRVARRPAGPRRHRRRAVGRAGDGRGGQPVADRRREERVRRPQGRLVGRRAARPPDVRRPAAQARLLPRHRRRGRHRARRRRPRPRGARAAGLDHRHLPPRRPDGHGRARPDPVALRPAGRRGARPRRRRGGRAARAVQPPGADPAPRARPGRRRRDQPVRRRAHQQPDVLRRRHPRRRGGQPDLVRGGHQGAGPRHLRSGAAAEPRVHAGRDTSEGAGN